MMYCQGFTRSVYKIFQRSHALRRYQNIGSIRVHPPSSLVTDRVNITGNGFESFLPITIRATVECQEEQLYFSSYGHYITCEDGTFDLSATESIGGSYSGVDDMGLFWSMKSKPGILNRLQMNNASIPLQYEFSVFHGHVKEFNEQHKICKTAVERLFLQRGVRRQLIRQKDVQGTLFIPPGEGPFPAIITIYGGMKRKQLVEDAAAIFANNGFVSFALAFYGYDGLPKMFNDGPLQIEKVETSLNFLSNLQCVDSNAIGVYGISKGASVGLAMAALLPQIKAAVSVNGGPFSIGQITTYRNQVFPELGVNPNKALRLPDGTLSFINCWDNYTVGHPSVYPFECSDADMLFIVGLDDQCVSSKDMAEFSKERMDIMNKSNYEIVQYAGMGHLIDAPFVPPCTLSPIFAMGGIFSYGGQDTRMHASQVVKVWSKVVSFFKKSLVI